MKRDLQTILSLLLKKLGYVTLSLQSSPSWPPSLRFTKDKNLILFDYFNALMAVEAAHRVS